MSNTSENQRKVHQGRNIKRFREMQGIKQETLAYELGDEWTQKKVSQLESQETIEEDLLAQVAKILHVTPDAIKLLTEENVINIISGSFHDQASGVNGINYNCDLNFNPIDKIVELYERLLISEKEKTDIPRNKE